MIEKIVFERYGVQLREIHAHDIEMIRQWRNSPEINSQMLDQRPISAEMQKKWFESLADNPQSEYLLAWFKNEPIGVVSLVNINLDNKTAEPGMYIYPETYRQNIVPFCVGFCLNDYAFELKQLDLLLGKILASNSASLRFHEACGYQLFLEETSKNAPTETAIQAEYIDVLQPYADTIKAVAQEYALTAALLPYFLSRENYEKAKKPIARFIRYD